ncbi:MAG TPA: HEAT repeat domain-containing protein [Candidatus Acidoferrales bacterium]|jgi:hypothetical protein|nr:HEAT repeat domain-containing protein [Candidatus Acidoferrales bacterium]
MKCEEVAQLLPDYLQGGAAAEQAAGVREHIVECASCQADADMWQRLGTLPDQQPGTALRSRFDALLQSYQEGRWEKANLAKEHGKFLDLHALAYWIRTPAVSVAWAAVLVLCGFFAGRYLDRDTNSAQQVAAMRQELKTTQQLMVLSMLQQQSASERLQGVSFSMQEHNADPKILEALLHTLRYDNSVDVRLASLDVLSHYGNRPDVHSGLIDALQAQQSPMVQVALIDVLVQLHRPDTLDHFKQLQQSPTLDPTVRKRLDWGIQQLS